MSPAFRRTASQTVWSGRIFEVRSERFRHADGAEVSRDIVRHRGAVGIVAHDDDHVWLVRQPREAVGEEALLEIPAGKVEGEGALDTAKRELAEEIGKAAARWEPLHHYWSSPGFTDERVDLFLATGLSDAAAEAEEDERIEVVPWPLERLDEAIDGCRDAKSLIALLWLRRLRDGR